MMIQDTNQPTGATQAETEIEATETVDVPGYSFARLKKMLGLDDSALRSLIRRSGVSVRALSDQRNCVRYAVEPNEIGILLALWQESRSASALRAARERDTAGTNGRSVEHRSQP